MLLDDLRYTACGYLDHVVHVQGDHVLHAHTGVRLPLVLAGGHAEPAEVGIPLVGGGVVDVEGPVRAVAVDHVTCAVRCPFGKDVVGLELALGTGVVAGVAVGDSGFAHDDAFQVVCRFHTGTQNFIPYEVLYSHEIAAGLRDY